jgi:hypothetical protein
MIGEECRSPFPEPFLGAKRKVLTGIPEVIPLDGNYSRKQTGRDRIGLVFKVTACIAALGLEPTYSEFVSLKRGWLG